MAYDFPTAPANGTTVLTAGQKFEYVASYPRWEYRGEAVLNDPIGVVVPGTNSWVTTATTLTATGCVEMSLDNVAWTQGPMAVANGTTFYTRWKTDVACEGAPHGTVITGTIKDDTTGAVQNYSKVIDRLPDAFTFSPATSSEPPTSVTSANPSFTLSGTNVDSYIWAALTTTSGGTAPSTAEYSVDAGATWNALPAAAGTASVSPGATVVVRFVTGDTVSTTDTLTVSVGESAGVSVSGTYGVTVDKPAFSPAPAVPTIADKVTTASTVWAAGAQNIYATGCLEFSVDGGATYTQASTFITDGTTLLTRWDEGVGVGTTCADAPHGTTIVGSIESATNANNFSLTVDRQPDAFNFTDQTNVGFTTVTTSNSVTVSGTNAVSYLQWTPAGTNPLTTVQASINGGAYVAIPAAGTYTLEVPPGATVTIQGTTGAGVSTAYSGTVTMGDSVASTTDVWTVTTVSLSPAVTAPTITSPIDGATNVGDYTGLTLTSSVYTPLNGAGVHNCTDWEVYKNSYPLQSTNTITSVTQNAQGAWTTAATMTGWGTNNIFGVYYGNGKWVAVGKDGKFSTSTDGSTWTSVATMTGWGTNAARSVHYGGGKWVAVGSSGSFSTSTDGSTWTSVATMPGWSGIDILSVAYGGGKWVAVGDGGKFSTSTDGSTWTSAATMTGWTVDSNSVAYGGGKWVAVGASGKFSTSTDGSTWTSSATMTGWSNNINSVAYGNGTWVAVGASGQFSTSTDGSTWTSSATMTGWTAVAINSVSYNGTWVAVGNNGSFSTSTDGSTWTSRATVSNGGQFLSVAGSGTSWVAVDNAGKFTTSAAATTTLAIAGCQTDGFEVGDIVDDCGGGAGPGTILSLNDTNVTLTSSTGFSVGEKICRATSSYSLISSATCDTVNLTSYPLAKPPLEGNTTYYARAQYNSIDPVASGYGAWSEFTTGTLVIGAGTWTPRTSGTTSQLFSVAWGSGLYAAGGASGTMVTSPDGITWTTRVSSFLATQINGITYGGSKFVAVGDNGKVATSPDGITWTQQTSGTANGLSGVTYGGSQFVAVGASGTILTSPDGVTWTSRTSGTAQNLFAVTYGNGLYVAGGANGVVRTSTDAITWTARTTPNTDTVAEIVYGNGVYVATYTTANRLMYSTDAITWTLNASIGGIIGANALAYGGGRFWLGGPNTSPDVATSTDGINWTGGNTTLAKFLQGMGYGTPGFVVVGNNGAIATNFG